MGDCGVRVATVGAHEPAAVAVTQLECNDVRRQLEYVQRVPGEVVAGGGIEIDLAEPSGAADPLQC
jgi:hypothetical protein